MLIHHYVVDTMNIPFLCFIHSKNIKVHVLYQRRVCFCQVVCRSCGLPDEKRQAYLQYKSVGSVGLIRLQTLHW